MTAAAISLMLFTGVIAGSLSGLMGVGGGTIIIPALVLFAGASQHMAQGISLAVIIPTAMIGSYGYYLKGNADTDAAVKLAIGAVPGAFIGSFIANGLNASDLRKVFGVFAIIIAIKVIKDVLSKQK